MTASASSTSQTPRPSYPDRHATGAPMCGTLSSSVARTIVRAVQLDKRRALVGPDAVAIDLLGPALYVYHHKLGNPRRFRQVHSYYGAQPYWE